MATTLGSLDVASSSWRTFMTGNLLGGLAHTGQDDHGLPGVTTTSKNAHQMTGVVECRNLFTLSRLQGDALAHAQFLLFVVADSYRLQVLDEGARREKHRRVL